jgi:hypothetical protein
MLSGLSLAGVALLALAVGGLARALGEWNKEKA